MIYMLKGNKDNPDINTDINKPKGMPQSLGEKEMRLIYDFTAKMVREFKLFIKSVVVFGSFARGDITPEGDIDILIIVDDGKIELQGEVKKFYETELKKIIFEEHSPMKFHVNTVVLSESWDGIRIGDPILLNIIREGLPIFDRGFFVPLKKLVEKGKVRPTIEAIYLCLDNADVHLLRAREFLLKSVSELYWAAIDYVNAAVMTKKMVPADPKHAANLLRRFFADEYKLSEDDIKFFEKLYSLMKKIGRGDLNDITGKEIDDLREKTMKFIERMKHIVIEEEKKHFSTSSGNT